MWEWTLLLYPYFAVVVTSVILSVTGQSFGLRLGATKLLLRLFEWAASLDEKEKPDDDDEEGHLVDKKDRTIINPKLTEVLRQKLNNVMENSGDEVAQTVEDGDQQMTAIREIVRSSLEFVTAGMECIVEDDVTCRFKAAHLASWNLLSRSLTSAHVNWKLGLLWFIGVVFRYTILLPVRFSLLCIGLGLLVITSALVGMVPNGRIKAVLNKYAMLMFMRTTARAYSAIITFHNPENRPKSGICVANHTSPIDVMMLSCDNCYAMVGQKQGGVLGLIQNSVSKCASHIWFERSEAGDRNAVRRKLQSHVNDPDKLPILIFPEGTCINNTSVMMFKKGSFEVTDVVYPIAMKYDNRLGDAFWNSSKEGYFSYMVSLMTSWALTCEIWYLPPMRRQENEDPIEFARRVKQQIAKQGGLVDLEWDGNLKRATVPERLKKAQKDLFYNYLARQTGMKSPS